MIEGGGPTLDDPSDGPAISFVIIVLNGEPFTRHTLRALYPFAHEIIVAEGASPGAAGIASADGHSTDETLSSLRSFQNLEDPEGRVRVLTAEDSGHPDGFWPGEKHEQSRAAFTQATGDYVWQVDIDEFYLPEQMAQVGQLLADDPSITGASFRQISFWGGLDYNSDGWYLRRGGDVFRRLFKWGKDYRYVTHRPPTVLDDHGQDACDGNWVEATTMESRGIRLLHYHMLLPKQVRDKMDYYQHASWAAHTRGLADWAQDAYFNLNKPYRVHNVTEYPSWLERYQGEHPEEILQMMSEEHAAGTARETTDIESLIDSPRYRLGRSVLSIGEPWERRARRVARKMRRARRL